MSLNSDIISAIFCDFWYCLVFFFLQFSAFSIIILHVAWTSVKSNENKLMIFEKKGLPRILGPKRNYKNGYKIRSNRELTTIFNEPNVVGILKNQ